MTELMRTHPINIAIAEDHPAVREGLVSLLSGYNSVNVLFAVGNGLDLLNKLRQIPPDVILLDINMPFMNGREALKQITSEFPLIKVIILLQHFSPHIIIDFLTHGACAFLKKNSDIEVIIAAVQSSFDRGFYYDPHILQLVRDHLPGLLLK